LLISDQSSGVGAILEKTRLQGVLRGTANGEVALERVMSDEQVAPGEKVMTSGGDQIFPKGLPVGTVTKVTNGRDLFLNITVKPAANLSKLEEVLVLVEKQDRLATAQEKVRVRAADILAQRLPSVPDKPAESSTTAGSTKPGAANTTAKPKSAPVASNAQTAKNPAGVAPQGAAAVPPKPKTTQPAPPKEPAATTLPVAKPETQEPSITEQKPATPPASQPTSPPNDGSPH
jgi:rod shape-determining protein MreC